MDSQYHPPACYSCQCKCMHLHNQHSLHVNGYAWSHISVIRQREVPCVQWCSCEAASQLAQKQGEVSCVGVPQNIKLRHLCLTRVLP